MNNKLNCNERKIIIISLKNHIKRLCNNISDQLTQNVQRNFKQELLLFLILIQSNYININNGSQYKNNSKNNVLRRKNLIQKKVKELLFHFIDFSILHALHHNFFVSHTI